MTNIEKLQHDVEIAQKQLEEATKSLEMAKKKLSKISLKVPEMGDNYYTGYSGTLQCCESVHYTAAFDSVSQPQQSAFQEALCVMAEMRVKMGLLSRLNNHLPIIQFHWKYTIVYLLIVGIIQLEPVCFLLLNLKMLLKQQSTL